MGRCRRRLPGVALDRPLGSARTTATPEDRGPPPMPSEKYSDLWFAAQCRVPARPCAPQRAPSGSVLGRGAVVGRRHERRGAPVPSDSTAAAAQRDEITQLLIGRTSASRAPRWAERSPSGRSPVAPQGLIRGFHGDPVAMRSVRAQSDALTAAIPMARRPSGRVCSATVGIRMTRRRRATAGARCPLIGIRRQPSHGYAIATRPSPRRGAVRAPRR